MPTKQPSYYRDLLESIIQEQDGWVKNVTVRYGDASIHMQINKPIDLGDDSVVLVRIEVPLVGFDGLMGLYFMDQDYDKLERFEKDPALWAELEKAVGAALGSGTVKLGRGRDLYEPLDGGDDPCIRAILPHGMDHKLLVQYIHAAGMDGAMKLLINAIASGDFASETIEVLKSCGVDETALAANKDSVLKALLTIIKKEGNVKRVMTLLDQLKLDWPEIASIRRSLDAAR